MGNMGPQAHYIIDGVAFSVGFIVLELQATRPLVLNSGFSLLALPRWKDSTCSTIYP